MNFKTKLSSLMYPPIALALLAACSSDDVLENNNETTTQGQTLTINATTGGEDGTRTIYDLGTDGTYEVITSKWDKDKDKVYVFGNSKNTNKGEFTISTLSTDGLTATLTGTIPEELTNDAWVNAYIANDGVVAVNSDNQLEVDYSEQDGTWQDAVKKSMLYGKTQYSKANNNNIPNLEFKYMTAFFKLTLKFPEISATTKANLCITGDKLASKSRINTVYNKGGGTNKIVDAGSINIQNVTIQDNGEAVIYFALYPQTIKNTNIQAELEDGSIYTFEVIPASKEVQIKNGYFYQFGREGKKIGNKNDLSTISLKGEGSSDNPYLIGNVLDLMKLQEMVTKKYYTNQYFKMTSDIAINGEWKPIGDNGHAFCGIFDGYGHSITGNMKFTSLAANGMAGLFGCVGANGVIKNLTNKANVTVTTSANLSSFVGGIVGRIRKNVTILNCANIGNITANAGVVGGVVGEAYVDLADAALESRVEACYNTGDITSTQEAPLVNGKKKGSVFVGGVIGHPAVKNTTSKFVIIGCYNKNNTISTPNEKVNSCGGGIAGSTNGEQKATDQVLIKACWDSSQSIDTKAAGLIASSSSISLFEMNNCWVNSISKAITNGGNKSAEGTTLKALLTNCYNGSGVKEKVELKNCIDAMNTVWGSSVYMFDTNGNIVKR